MEFTLQLTKAHEIKAIIDTLKPVTEWHMTAKVWNAAHVARVYVNDPKGKTAAIINIDKAGQVTAKWQPGHSMTRNEIAHRLGLAL